MRIKSEEAKTATRTLDGMQKVAIKLDVTVRGLERTVAKTDERIAKQTSTFDKLKARVLAAAAAYVTLRTAMSVIRDLQEFEVGLVGVGKTTGLVGAELDEFGNKIALLGTRLPVPTERLLGIAETAAQLGVEGSSNLLLFTETMARLETATDVAGEEGAKSIARLLNVTREGVDEVAAFGSVLVGLGNTSEATESEILHLATQVAQGGAQFNISSTDALALGAAYASMGVAAELAGSVTQRALFAIDKAVREGGSGLVELERIMGLTGAEIQKVFAEDSVRAFEMFLGSLGRAIEQNESAADILDELGIANTRVLKILPTLALSHENLTEKITEARIEQEKSLALNAEFVQFAGTSASAYKRLQNSITAIRQEHLDYTGVLSKATDTLSESLLVTFGLVEVTEDTSNAVRVLTPLIVGLTATITTLLLVASAAKLGAIIDGVGGITIAVRTLFTTIASHPLGLLAVGIGLVVAGLVAMSQRTEEATANLKLQEQVTRDLEQALLDAAEAQDLFSIAQQTGREDDTQRALQARIALLNQLKDLLQDFTKLETPGIDRFPVPFEQRGLTQGFLNRRQDLAEQGLIESQLADVFLKQAGLDASQLETQALAQGVRAINPGEAGGDLELIPSRFVAVADVMRLLSAEVDNAQGEMEAFSEAARDQSDAVRDAARSLDAELESIQELGEFLNLLEEDVSRFGLTERQLARVTTIERVRELGEAGGFTAGEIAQLQARSLGLVDQLYDLKDASAEAAEESLALAQAQQEAHTALGLVQQRIGALQSERDMLGLSNEERSIRMELLQAEISLQSLDAATRDSMLGRLEDELRLTHDLNAARSEAERTAQRQQQATNRIGGTLAGAMDAAELAGQIRDIQLQDPTADLALEEQVLKSRLQLTDLQSAAGVEDTGEQAQLETMIRLEAERRQQIELTIEAQQRHAELANRINDQLADTFADMITGARSAEEAARELASELLSVFLRQQVLAPVLNTFNPGGILAGFLGSADGNVFGGGGVEYFAKGGIVGGPTAFQFGGGRLGLMGEAGPEAVVPLSRGADGKLGIASQGGGGGNTVINMKVVTQDANSFRQNRRHIMRDVEQAGQARVGRGVV